LDAAGHLLGGLVAGEGCFRRTERRERFTDGTPRVRFVFELSLAAVDRPLIEALHQLLGCAGSVRERAPRRPGWQPETCLTIASERSHLDHTIPFAERFLDDCHKRTQFEAWRDELLSYRHRRDVLRPPGRAHCRIVGCEDLVRGRGLCRRHYYEATGW